MLVISALLYYFSKIIEEKETSKHVLLAYSLQFFRSRFSTFLVETKTKRFDRMVNTHVICSYGQRITTLPVSLSASFLALWQKLHDKFYT